MAETTTYLRHTMTTLTLTLTDGRILLDNTLPLRVHVHDADSGHDYDSGCPSGGEVAVEIADSQATAVSVPAGMLVEIADYDTGVRDVFDEHGFVSSDWTLGELAA